VREGREEESEKDCLYWVVVGVGGGLKERECVWCVCVVEVRASEESVEMKRREPAKIGQSRLARFGLA
jgi:hypothetical protein